MNNSDKVYSPKEVEDIFSNFDTNKKEWDDVTNIGYRSTRLRLNYGGQANNTRLRQGFGGQVNPTNNIERPVNGNNTNDTNVVKVKKNWLMIGVIGFVGVIVVLGVILAVVNYVNVPNQSEQQQILITDKENYVPIETVGGQDVQDVVAPEPEKPVIVDSDSDGLNDEEEAQYRTNPNKPDTDNDGLFDGEEVKLYKTNPLSSDSDADGFLDGEEIKGGYNHLGPGKLLNFEEAIMKLKKSNE